MFLHRDQSSNDLKIIDYKSINPKDTQHPKSEVNREKSVSTWLDLGFPAPKRRRKIYKKTFNFLSTYKILVFPDLVTWEVFENFSFFRIAVVLLMFFLACQFTGVGHVGIRLNLDRIECK